MQELHKHSCSDRLTVALLGLSSCEVLRNSPCVKYALHPDGSPVVAEHLTQNLAHCSNLSGMYLHVLLLFGLFVR